jgi:hypothetical protein
MPPSAAEARHILRAYFEDLSTRYYGRPATGGEIDQALRLDTRHDLAEARRMYARHGYREVAPFNESPYADHWFAKPLA